MPSLLITRFQCRIQAFWFCTGQTSTMSQNRSTICTLKTLKEILLLPRSQASKLFKSFHSKLGNIVRSFSASQESLATSEFNSVHLPFSLSLFLFSLQSLLTVFQIGFEILVARGRSSLIPGTIGSTYGHSAAIEAFSISATPALGTQSFYSALQSGPVGVEPFTSQGKLSAISSLHSPLFLTLLLYLFDLLQDQERFSLKMGLPSPQGYSILLEDLTGSRFLDLILTLTLFAFSFSSFSPSSPSSSVIWAIYFFASHIKSFSKPDFTAVDGVSTATPGFSTFYGTSAAAPAAAAIAALMISARPSITHEEMTSVFIQTSLDILWPGYDDISGHGILDAKRILHHLCKIHLSLFLYLSLLLSLFDFSFSFNWILKFDFHVSCFMFHVFISFHFFILFYSIFSFFIVFFFFFHFSYFIFHLLFYY